jgi:hypothetical protein
VTKRKSRSLRKLLDIFGLLLSLAVILSSCRSDQAGPVKASPTLSMKGYELYSWQMEGDWYFALVVGTNRIKTYDEISTPEVRVQGLAALQAKLDQMPRGEQVFWSARRVPGTPLPPAEIIDAVHAHCSQRGIQLYIEPAATAITRITPTPQPAVTPHSTPTPAPVSKPTPYCQPDDAAVNLSASATSLQVGQTLSVTIILTNGEASAVQLGNIQYVLEIQSSGVLTAYNPEPLVHPLSLEPGRSDRAEFVLKAAMPGRVMLTGSTSFEIHPLDYAWGSWSGCLSEPLEIVVAPPATAGPTPTLTPAPRIPPPDSRSVFPTDAEPLLIDGEKGWLFVSAQVDDQPKTVKLSTADGHLLEAYDVVGKLALDRTGERLIVDQGAAGVAILDERTGALHATMSLPIKDPAPVDPQVDPTTGLAYAFRDKTVYVIDPAAAAILRAETFSIAVSVCGDPGEDAPVARSFYDLVNHRLYLAFVTYVCTPWVHQTIVAYDAGTLTELGRYETELRYQAVPFSDSLYGTTAGRLGRNVSWAWNGREVWFEQGDQGRSLQGIVADWERQLVYEALDGQIWVLTPYPREVIQRVDIPTLAGGGRLVGHDPISDQLYFLLIDGQLEVRPTLAILPSLSQLPDAPLAAR